MKNKKKIYISLVIVSMFALAMCKTDSKKQEETSSTEFAKTEQTDTLSKSSDSTKLSYICPPCACAMHDSIFTSPGTCPGCGMALVLKK
jgi:rubrerythrin